MATITISRGSRSAAVWIYLTRNNIQFSAYRLYEADSGSESVRMAYTIADPAVAVELVLRYA